MNKIFLVALLLLAACGQEPITPVQDAGTPAPVEPASDFLATYRGMFELLYNCSDGTGFNNSVPSSWRVTDAMDGGLSVAWQDESGDLDATRTDDACSPLSVSLTPDGGVVEPKSCSDGRVITGGGIWNQDPRTMQAWVEVVLVRDGANCKGEELAAMDH